MEQIGRVDVVAFDKTGTLTLGEPHLGEVVSLNGFDNRELLALVAGAERFQRASPGAGHRGRARGGMGWSPWFPSACAACPGTASRPRWEGERWSSASACLHWSRSRWSRVSWRACPSWPPRVQR